MKWLRVKKLRGWGGWAYSLCGAQWPATHTEWGVKNTKRVRVISTTISENRNDAKAELQAAQERGREAKLVKRRVTEWAEDGD